MPDTDLIAELERAAGKMPFRFDPPKGYASEYLLRSIEVEWVNTVIEAWPRILAALKQAKADREQRDKLQAFKDWVHQYLDDHGVPHHPPGTHGAEGCRIGDRMDWLMNQRDELAKEVERMKGMLQIWLDNSTCYCGDWMAMGAGKVGRKCVPCQTRDFLAGNKSG